MNGVLYWFTVIIWGSSWFPVRYQVGVVPPEVSVAYRFALAAALIFSVLLLRRINLRFGLREHLFMALQGVTVFSTNCFVFYLASPHLTSGLLAVIFSTAVVMNIVNGWLFLRIRTIDPKVLLGALLGLAGIVVIFWPEFSRFDANGETTYAVGLSLLGTCLFSLGNILSLRNQRAGIPILPSTAYGMMYGASFLGLVALLRGSAFTFDASTGYIVSLIFLTVFSSVVAFGCYLTLMGRIGADRAAYVTVLFPIVALGISTVFEDFSWRFAAVAGVVLTLLGNVLVLSGTRLARKISPPETVALSPGRRRG